MLNPTIHIPLLPQSRRTVSICGVCTVFIIFEIKDLTYNAQFNSCLLSTPSCLGAFLDRSEFAHSAAADLTQLSLLRLAQLSLHHLAQLSLRFIIGRGVV